MDKQLKPLPPAFPATADAWERFIKTQRNINDEVESIHIALLNDKDQCERYQRLLYAVYDEQAVEGSLSADNTLAAIMIREKAASQDAGHPLAGEKLATISKALGVVLRRYRQSRKQRRDTVDGEVVPSESNND